MDREFIKNAVLYQGCISLDTMTLRAIFPKGYSPGPHQWNQAALEAWCRVNRIDCEVDQTTKTVYFTPAGVFVPSQL